MMEEVIPEYERSFDSIEWNHWC